MPLRVYEKQSPVERKNLVYGHEPSKRRLLGANALATTQLKTRACASGAGSDQWVRRMLKHAPQITPYFKPNLNSM